MIFKCLVIMQITNLRSEIKLVIKNAYSMSVKMNFKYFKVWRISAAEGIV